MHQNKYLKTTKITHKTGIMSMQIHAIMYNGIQCELKT